ncbi:DUF2795 domain-containing protein [Streptomyces sp. NPDC020983]|uniref:DUF2795 domain-containing protein n=1 Tax=Streptomyces sp. NPDC020983 TaxID=3365106 RepID=UPI0037B252F1
MADQGSNRTGPARDDELKRESQGELKANLALRPEEAYEPEPAGGDRSVAEWRPGGPESSAPPGMTPTDVEVRSALARHLEPSAFPADRGELLTALRRHQAPDGYITLVDGLPADRSYTNVQEVMRTLGFGVEAGRT